MAASTGISRARLRLRDAVAKRWLDRVNAPLEKIAEGAGPAPARLERWLRALCTTKQKKVCDDPEMFATYLTLAREARDVVKCHKERLIDQIAHILSDGVKQGAFQVADVKACGARGVRRHLPLSSSRPCRGMERSGAGGADRRLAGAAAEGSRGAAAPALGVRRRRSRQVAGLAEQPGQTISPRAAAAASRIAEILAL